MILLLLLNSQKQENENNIHLKSTTQYLAKIERLLANIQGSLRHERADTRIRLWTQVFVHKV